jgi:hypothetical protein
MRYRCTAALRSQVKRTQPRSRPSMAPQKGSLLQVDEEQSRLAKQIERDLLRPLRFRWLGYLSSLGALITSFWLIYLAYEARGILAAIAAFALLSLCYGAGPALMFAAASSFICFYYHAVGLWLPIASYVAAGVMLFVAIRLRRSRCSDVQMLVAVAEQR